RMGVSEVLEKAPEGERIDDDDAAALLRSRDLVAVGRTAHAVRNRKHDPDRVTFIVDRNLNYTNICVTDCDFCAFYRSPGDVREGYLLPKPVIFKKIEETLAIGGTGLDSIPGGGGEVLVDRVRDVIAPKKTKSSEWLNVMRHAHRLGISTTATMMYGHVETLEERVEHMRRIREVQDETGGFRAFFSWTFQDDGNRLGEKVPPETRPTSFDYLLTTAVSRIYLANVPHTGSSWA